MRLKQSRRVAIKRDLLDPHRGYSATKAAVDNSVLFRAERRLVELVAKERFDQALIIFTELIKTSRYSIVNTWKTGAEIVGKCAPQLLRDYLKFVYIYSPKKHAPVTFNAYIDQLMLEKKWSLALDEIDLVFSRAKFNQPIFLRKMGECAYRLWEEAKNSLPKEYFEDEFMEDVDESLVANYKRRLETANKYLPLACKEYIRDPEILEFCCNILTCIGDEETKKEYILRALKEVKKKPDFHLLFLLVKMNEQNIYFKSKPYITFLYEMNPYLDASYGLLDYVKRTVKQLRLKKLSGDKANQRSAKLLEIFVYRAQHNNFDMDYLRKLHEIFQLGITRELYDIWISKDVYRLLSSPAVINNEDKLVVKQLSIEMNMKVLELISI